MNILKIISKLEDIFPDELTNDFINSMPRKKLTAEQKARPYSKYYYKDMAKIPQADLDIINAGPISSKKALSIYEAKEILKDGYLEAETGYCVMPNRTGFAATKVFMPNVTPKMINWWFNWHPLEGLRYMIWCPVGHTDISAKEPNKHLDNTYVPLKIRNIGTTHYPEEGFNVEGSTNIEIKFRSPQILGITPDMVKNSSMKAFQIATCSNKIPPIPINIFFHAVRLVNGGVEFRSHYWLNYTIKNNKISVSKIPLPIQVVSALAKNNCIHSLIEYNNLASILPQLYKEQAGQIN
ncbi:MAG: hypothetical protein BEN18_03930 [Epulopiscium sp. Nuni2H_MBin001]|nr:MAG: hypothetical protein BEN18_03930 [Epulopiscium sp. Nuni2H_MBin001]